MPGGHLLLNALRLAAGIYQWMPRARRCGWTRRWPPPDRNGGGRAFGLGAMCQPPAVPGLEGRCHRRPSGAFRGPDRSGGARRRHAPFWPGLEPHRRHRGPGRTEREGPAPGDREATGEGCSVESMGAGSRTTNGNPRGRPCGSAAYSSGRAPVALVMRLGSFGDRVDDGPGFRNVPGKRFKTRRPSDIERRPGGRRRGRRPTPAWRRDGTRRRGSRRTASPRRIPLLEQVAHLRLVDPAQRQRRLVARDDRACGVKLVEDEACDHRRACCGGGDR